MGQTEILSTKITKLDSQRHGRSYLGKKVYSKEGNIVGIVKDLFIGKGAMTGFFVLGRRKLFIDKEYVASESEKSIMLSIEPVLLVIGKKVFDSDGRKVGYVSGIDRKSNSNNYVALLVKSNLFSKAFSIPKEDVEVFKENVILNRAYPK